MHSIPQGIDFVAGAGGEAVNLGAKGLNAALGTELPTAPFGAIYKATNYADKAASNVIGKPYEPEYKWTGGAAELVGNVIGQSGAAKIASNAVGFAKGAMGSLDNWIKDPSKLVEAYQDWEKGLEATTFAKKYLKDELVTPFLEKIKFDLPTMRDPKALEAVDAIQATKGLPNARYLEGARRNLSGNPTGAAQAGRKQIDETLQAAGVDLGGRDSYRRAMDVEDLQKALRNQGNERIGATRTKINNMDEAGMSAAELAAKYDAGRAGLGEKALRAFDGVGNIALSAVNAANAGPIAGAMQYLGGKGLGRLGDAVAERKIKAFQEVLMNKRASPNMGEKAGAALRKILMKAR